MYMYLNKVVGKEKVLPERDVVHRASLTDDLTHPCRLKDSHTGLCVIHPAS